MNWGERFGQPTTTLLTSNLPNHAHGGTVKVADDKGDSFGAPNNYLAKRAVDVDASPNTTVEMYIDNANPKFNDNNRLLGVDTNTTVGANNTAFSNQPPSLGINYIIALQGIFPSRS